MEGGGATPETWVLNLNKSGFEGERVNGCIGRDLY